MITTIQVYTINQFKKKEEEAEEQKTFSYSEHVAFYYIHSPYLYACVNNKQHLVNVSK